MKRATPFLFFLLIAAAYLYVAYQRIYDIRPRLVAPSIDVVKYLNNPNSEKNVKYVALGDSLTVGVGSSDPHKIIPYFFAASLAKKYSVTVVNLAYPGATTEDVLKNQLPRVIAEEPDVVTLLIGVNDLHNLRSLSSFSDNYRLIVDALKQTPADTIVMSLPYLGSDMLVWPPYNYLLDFRTQQFNKIIEQIARENNLVYVNLYNKEKEFQNDDFYSDDNFHPSEKGYLILGELINAGYNQ